MAKLFEISPEQRAWLDSRPPVIKAMTDRWPPNLLYRLKTTDQRVTLYSYSEGGTVTVDVTGDFNLHIMDVQVFGIDPNDLEECDLPGGEPLGTMLVEDKDVEDYIDKIRPLILAQRKRGTH
jgi:hypothetical protein